jgi:serine protease Do
VFDSNSGTLNDSRNEVWGYVNVIEDNGEYSLTQKLLQNAFSELNLEHVHDSLDAFVNYASVDEGQTLSSEDIHAKIASAAFLIYSPSGESIGTGFFIGNNGLAVSNSHVVGNDSGCQIYLFGSDGSLNRSIYYTFKKIVFNGANENLDLVIFYVDLDGNESNYIPLSRRDPVVGMKAFAFGNPRGLMGTFSAGQVSALREDIYMIQIDTPITNGNSGGPVVNDKGHAIGVSAAGIEGGGNLNFAVDTRIVRMILSELGIEIPKK